MLRGFLRIAIPCLLLIAVLAAAKYMDSAGYALRNQSSGKPLQTNAVVQETQPAYTETTEPAETEPAETTVVTEPEETQPAETELEATVSDATEPAETVSDEVEQQTFVFTFLGDCTLGAVPTAYYAEVGFVKTIGEDYLYPFENVRQYMENDDFTFLNLEGPLTDTGNPIESRYTFRGPERFVNILTMNSVEGVTIANNHTLDYGMTGMNNTRRVLDEAQIPYAEKDCSRVVTLENGLTVGLYATSFASLDKAAMVSEISAMREQGVNVIIYAAHWGTEGSYRPSGEQKELAYAAIDAGANIVFGTHPHVLQPIEEYNGGVILYSMANFSFGGHQQLRDMDTAVVQQEVILQPDGTVVLGERNLVPCSISSREQFNNYQPTPYEVGSEEYNRVLEKLSGTFTGRDLVME